MSIKAMTHVWEHSKQKGSALLMMLALADHADDYGVCYPGVDRLAKKTRLKRRQAQRLLNNLEDNGEIVRDMQSGVETGHGKTNRYYLASYRKSIGLSEGVSSSTPHDNEGVSSSTSLGVSQSTPLGVSSSTPKPSGEPSVKPSDNSANAADVSNPTTIEEPSPIAEPIQPTRYQAIVDSWLAYGGRLASPNTSRYLDDVIKTPLTEAQIVAAFGGCRCTQDLLQDMDRRANVYALAADLLHEPPPGITTVGFNEALRIAAILINQYHVTDAATAIERLLAYKQSNNLTTGGLGMLDRAEVAGYVSKSVPSEVGQIELGGVVYDSYDDYLKAQQEALSA